MNTQSLPSFFKILFTSVLLLPQSAMAQEPKAQICHTANAGFYISDGHGTGVLIDSLMFTGLNGYDRPEHNLMVDIERLQGKFSDVKLVFATHRHHDHYRWQGIAKHLFYNAKKKLNTQYALTQQAYDDIIPQVDTSSGTFTILKNANKIDIPLNINNIRATAYKVSHGSDKIQNYGLFLEIGGTSFFHPGDISTTIEALKKNNIDKLDIDYLMMPFWMLLDRTSIELTKGAFNFKHIIPMHIPIIKKDWMKSQGGLKTIVERAHRVFPHKTIKLLGQNACASIN